MQARATKAKHSPQASDTSVSHTPVTVKHHQKANRLPDHEGNRKARRDVRAPPTMFFDPMDSSPSDTESFNEDDMYGSDSGDEIISLRTVSKEKAQSPDDPSVCTSSCADFVLSRYLMFEAGHRSYAPVREVGNVHE